MSGISDIESIVGDRKWKLGYFFGVVVAEHCEILKEMGM